MDNNTILVILGNAVLVIYVMAQIVLNTIKKRTAHEEVKRSATEETQIISNQQQMIQKLFTECINAQLATIKELKAIDNGYAELRGAIADRNHDVVIIKDQLALM